MRIQSEELELIVKQLISLNQILAQINWSLEKIANPMNMESLSNKIPEDKNSTRGGE